MIIRNKSELISRGNRKGRKIALDVIENALKSINSFELTQSCVFVEKEILFVRNKKYDLSEVEDIYVIGAGKASFSIAKALDETLGRRISKGVIVVKKGERRRLDNIKIIEAGHPIPDRRGLDGAKVIVDIAEEAGCDDLSFVVVTGGASSLLPLPAEEITLEEKRNITDLLLRSGANIKEINTVRKHISAIKGGRLANYIHPAKIINLIVSDEVGGGIWGPTVPDKTTHLEAVHILKKYKIWSTASTSIRDYLAKGTIDPSFETPKPEDSHELCIQNIILSDNASVCRAAKKRVEELGIRPLILTSQLEGESREAGTVFASIAKDVTETGWPIKPPCVLILGGETTVTISGEYGRGGPSQEFALGASLKIDGDEKIVISSIDTDGTDGSTNSAGGIVDGHTLKRAIEGGFDVFKSLMEHNSHKVLSALCDVIYTNPTETNVMDLNIAVVT
jgi:glycerate-2-kinase